MSCAERQELYRKRCFYLRQLLHEQQQRGLLPEPVIRRYATRMQTSPRNLRRWVVRGEVPSNVRSGVDPNDERLQELLIELGGNVAAAADVLALERGRGYSHRNPQRVIAEKLPADKRAELRGGARARRDAQLMFRLVIENPNEAWFVDHKESSVWVVHPVTGEVVKAWLSSVVDGCSRALMACIATPGRPTKEDVKVLLFRAIGQTENWPAGGLPLLITWDNDLTFTAKTMTDILDELNINPQNIDSYSPTQNGYAERFNLTIDQRLSRAQLAYAKGAKQRNGELYSGHEDALAWSVFLAKLDEFTNWYRFEHKHSEIGNRHTEAEWLRLTAPLNLPRCSPGDVVWLLPGLEEGSVRAAGGIHKWNNRYFDGKLIDEVGRRVQFAFSPWDTRTIEVIVNGKWLCTAKAAPPTRVEQQQHSGRLGARAQEMSQRRKRVNDERRDENAQMALELPEAAALTTPAHVTPTAPPTASTTSRREPAPADIAERNNLQSVELDDELYDLDGLAQPGEEQAS